MNLEEMNQKRHKVLDSLYEELTDELVPARLLEAEMIGDVEQPEMLSVLFEDLVTDRADALGDFFFPASEEDDVIQYFHNVLTLDEEVPEENMEALVHATTIVNLYIPSGAFVVNLREKSIVYRYSNVMPMDLSDEELRDAVDMSMAVALQMVQRLGYMMIEVARGERDPESLYIFGEETNEE